MMITLVVIGSKVQKKILKIPKEIRTKLRVWVLAVGVEGVEELRKIPGYHDEPLRGKLLGYRSIRLNRSYRAIYIIKKNEVEFVSIEEVSKHEY